MSKEIKINLSGDIDTISPDSFVVAEIYGSNERILAYDLEQQYINYINMIMHHKDK